MAAVADSFEIDGFSLHNKFFSDALRHFDFVKRLVMEIEDFFALYTFEMLMVHHISIESFGVARTFHDKCRPDFI